MIRNFLTIFLLIAGIVLPTIGNTQSCATPYHANLEFDATAFEEFRRNNKSSSRNKNKRRIGITIHVVQGTIDGANIDITQLYDEVDAVNRFFTGAGIEFFLCGAPRIVLDRILYTYSDASRQLNTRSNHEPNTINVYYVDEIGNQLTSSACGISTFPWNGGSDSRFIIMQKDCSTNGTVLAHEIGHFFGLFHTHETAAGVELVNRSNCETAGDLICDTPADPNLSIVGLNGCTYEGNFTDRNGDRYNPDPSNIMSYAPLSCTSRFSPGQNDLMNFYLESTDLADFITDCDFFPDFAIKEENTINTIASGQTMALTYEFNTEGVTEPIEVDISFMLQETDSPLNFTIHTETITIQPGEDLFEITFQVPLPIEYASGDYTLTTALDPKSLIQEQDKRNNFLSSNLKIDNSNLSDNLLFPNPVQEEVKVFLRERGSTGDVNLIISDALGRVYLREKKFKGETEFSTRVQVGDLPEGLYILTLEFIIGGKSKSFLFYKE